MVFGLVTFTCRVCGPVLDTYPHAKVECRCGRRAYSPSALDKSMKRAVQRRNTVLQRVHRAEELLARPVAQRPAELHAAVLLAAALPEAVLGADWSP